MTLGHGPGMWGRQTAAAVLGHFDHDLSVEEIAAALAPDDVSPGVLRQRIKGVEKGHFSWSWYRVFSPEHGWVRLKTISSSHFQSVI